jgi:prepilin-type N-terminal cleavage/methylation domain-containing protein
MARPLRGLYTLVKQTQQSAETGFLIQGFTMIEILAVLIVLAVVTTVVMTRTPAVERNAFTQAIVLRAHLRFAQTMAMTNDQEIWGVTLTPASYTLIQDGSPAAIRLPNDNSSTHNLPPGVVLTSAVDTILFDRWGSPGETTIAIDISGQTVSITRNTGFIP